MALKQHKAKYQSTQIEQIKKRGKYYGRVKKSRKPMIVFNITVLLLS